MWNTLRTSLVPFAQCFPHLTSVPLVTVAVALSAQPAQPVPRTSAPFASPIATLTSPAPEGSAQPNLAADRNGRVWLSWLESRSGGGQKFQLASLQGTTWSRAITIGEGTEFLANWADFPSIFVTTSGTLAAHWLQRGVGTPYGIQLRTSSDGGRTWTPAETPHRDRK